MNRIGLELIKQVDLKSEGLSELVSNQLLPNKFIDFISLYSIGYQSFNLEKIVLDDEEMDIYPLTTISIYDGVMMYEEEYHATIDHIFPYVQIVNEISNYNDKVENWHHKGFIQIGLLFHGDVLLLGIENDNRDEIWRYGQGLLNKVHSKLEDNIFSFFCKAKEKVLIEDLEDWKINVDQLYKNWKDDFWRVKR